MITFPGCKINLGLRILRRRPDGYHDIETVMLPVRGLSDVLEVVPGSGASHSLVVSGQHIDCPTEKNLVMKAVRALEGEVGELPPLDIYLRKIVPDGAGLGGGSADAAFTLKAVNDLCGLGLDSSTLKRLTARIGADCPFFIESVPMLCSGIGDIMHPISLPLEGYTILIVKPDCSVSTAEAYAGVSPHVPDTSLAEDLRLPVESWSSCIVNDFEQSVFARLPILDTIKERISSLGAVYTAMSGSGSALFGLFAPGYDIPEAEALQSLFPHCFLKATCI